MKIPKRENKLIIGFINKHVLAFASVLELAVNSVPACFVS
jgi:hypothetical protein